MKTATARVKRVLHMVDELDLDEIRLLRNELDARQDCEIDLSACKTPEDRELALTIQQRVRAIESGQAELIPFGEMMKRVRAEIRQIQTKRRRVKGR